MKKVLQTRMLPNKQTLFLAICLLVVVALCTVLISKREPHLGGRTLSEWHQQWWKAYNNGDQPREAEARAAIGQIGTNAIPYALEVISHPFSNEYYSFSTLPLVRRLELSERSELKKAAAAHLFYHLGSECKPWISDVLQLINTAEFDEVRSRATFCLAAMGDTALLEITNIVANTNHLSWRNAIHCLTLQDLHLDSTRTAVLPMLIEFSKSDDQEVSTRSIKALGAFRMQAEVVMPVFMDAWHHPNASVRAAAVFALGYFDESSIAELALTDPEPMIRSAGTNALEMIRTNSPTLVQKIIRNPEFPPSGRKF